MSTKYTVIAENVSIEVNQIEGLSIGESADLALLNMGFTRKRKDGLPCNVAEQNGDDYEDIVITDAMKTHLATDAEKTKSFTEILIAGAKEKLNTRINEIATDAVDKVDAVADMILNYIKDLNLGAGSEFILESVSKTLTEYVFSLDGMKNDEINVVTSKVVNGLGIASQLKTAEATYTESLINPIAEIDVDRKKRPTYFQFPVSNEPVIPPKTTVVNINATATASPMVEPAIESGDGIVVKLVEQPKVAPLAAPVHPIENKVPARDIKDIKKSVNFNGGADLFSREEAAVLRYVDMTTLPKNSSANTYKNTIRRLYKILTDPEILAACAELGASTQFAFNRFASHQLHTLVAQSNTGGQVFINVYSWNSCAVSNVEDYRGRN